MTVELRTLALAVLVGFLCGSILSRRARGRWDQPSARIFSFVLEPIFYWFDLKGTDGRPSRSKVAYFITLIVVLAGLIRFGMHQVVHHASETNGHDLSWPFIVYVLLVLVYSLGPQAFNAFLSSKLGDVIRMARVGWDPRPARSDDVRPGYPPERL